MKKRIFIQLGLACLLVMSFKPARGADRLIHDFEKGLPEIFSDHEEFSVSKNAVQVSTIAAGHQGQGMRLDYSVKAYPKQAWQYAGASFSMKGLSLKGMRRVSFWARLTQGQAPQLKVQITSLDPLIRQGVPVNLSGLGKDWVHFEVSLEKFNRLDDDAWGRLKDLALVVTLNQGSIEIDDLRADQVPVQQTRVPVPARSPRELPKGLGVWCYGDMTINAKAITDYNKTAPRDRRLVYVFAWAGDFSASTGKPTYKPDFTAAKKLAKLINDPQVLVFATVDGVSQGCELPSDADWDKVGKALATNIDAEPSLAGLHLDIEPHTDDVHKFFAAIKRHTRKPLSAAVGAWSKDTFLYVDQLCLMGYDLESTPKAFGVTATRTYGRFMADARAAGGKALLGVPAIATHAEYESCAKQKTDLSLSPDSRWMIFLIKRCWRREKRCERMTRLSWACLFGPFCLSRLCMVPMTASGSIRPRSTRAYGASLPNRCLGIEA